MGLCNGVQLVKKENTWCCLASLVKHFSDVRLTFSKPHSEHLWSLNADKVGLAFIGYGLGKQCFTTTWRSIEKHTFAWGHSKFEIFHCDSKRIHDFSINGFFFPH